MARNFSNLVISINLWSHEAQQTPDNVAVKETHNQTTKNQRKKKCGSSQREVIHHIQENNDSSDS